MCGPERGGSYQHTQEISTNTMLTYLGLRKSEVRPDKDDPRASTPDEACVALQIPRIGIHEVVFQRASDDTEDVGCVSCETDGFLAVSDHQRMNCHEAECNSNYRKRVDPISAGSAQPEAH